MAENPIPTLVLINSKAKIMLISATQRFEPIITPKNSLIDRDRTYYKQGNNKNTRK
jgi:hypothetical protein